MSSNYPPHADDVLSVIGQLSQSNDTLELTKSYKGIVLQQAVDILEVKPEAAIFRVNSVEMCTALRGDVYLLNQSFPKPVKAHLKSLDIRHGIIILSDFTFTEIEWGKRQYERFQPKNPYYATLRWKGKTVRAGIENISVNGIGVLANHRFERRMKIQPGASIHLDFQLAPDQIYTAVEGKVIYLKTLGRSLVKIGMQLFPKIGEARKLEDYFAHRKQEILGELNQAYWDMRMPRGVESLYF
jgi:hypothetical protein